MAQKAILAKSRYFTPMFNLPGFGGNFALIKNGYMIFSSDLNCRQLESKKERC